MNEHPMLFSGPMVRAILAGKKTQTRRIAKERQPSYALGDHLWVRETWAVGPCYNNIAPRERTKTLCPRNITYRADKRLDNVGRNHGRWRPSIHMPRRFSRMTLDVVEVRCEHLQDITVEDIIAEGLSTTLREHDACCDLRDQWVELWNSINAKRGYGWDTNPLVWVITFRNTTEEAKTDA